MKQTAKQLIKHPLIYGSSIVVTGSILANFFNFLFNLYMSRSLSVTDYGTLATIISLITFPALFVTALNPVIIRFAGGYFAKNEFALLKGFYKQFFIFLLICGTVLFIIFLIFISQIAHFFHINNYIILLFTNIYIFIAIISVINLSLLQAKLAFAFQVIIGLVSAILKLLLGIIFVIAGFSISGATGALVISTMSGFILSFWPLRFLFKTKAKTPDINSKDLFSYGIPSALTLFGLISFISSDIILVKHFFNPIQAGQYDGLSLVGRIIFFITAPIGTVMFPIIVQKHTKGINFSNTFKLALILVLIPSVLLTLFYFIFPKFSILFFLKREYLSIAPLLGLFGLYITFYCMLYLFVNFYLSIKKTKIYIPVLFAAFLQIILICLFHHTFLQIIMISFILILVLLTGFLLYYPYAT